MKTLFLLAATLTVLILGIGNAAAQQLVGINETVYTQNNANWVSFGPQFTFTSATLVLYQVEDKTYTTDSLNGSILQSPSGWPEMGEVFVQVLDVNSGTSYGGTVTCGAFSIGPGGGDTFDDGSGMNASINFGTLPAGTYQLQLQRRGGSGYSTYAQQLPDMYSVMYGTVIAADTLSPQVQAAVQAAEDAAAAGDTALQSQLNEVAQELLNLQSAAPNYGSLTDAQLATMEQFGILTAPQVQDIQLFRDDLTPSEQEILQTGGTFTQDQINTIVARGQLTSDQVASLEATPLFQASDLATIAGSLQTQINALETQFASLTPQTVPSTPVVSTSKKAGPNYLMIGGAAAGAVGMGLGSYYLFFDHSSSASASVEPPASTDVPDSYVDDRDYSPSQP